MVLDQLFRRLRGEPEIVSVSLDGCNLGSGSIGVGDTVSVSADVVNATTDTLEANVDFTAGGQDVDSALVSLPPGGTRTATTSLSYSQLSNWEGGSVSIGAESGFDTASCGSISVASAPGIDPDPDPDPPSWSIDNCQGVPNSLAEGESFLASASLTNTGGQEGTVTAELRVGGNTWQTVEKTLMPDQTDTVNFFSIDHSELVNHFGTGSSVSIDAVAGHGSTNCGSVTLDDPSDQPDPASFRVDTCEGVPNALSEGGDFIPQGWITNTGDQQGTVTVEFRINGQTRQTYEDTVAPGGTTPAPFDAVSWSTLDADFGAGQSLSTSIVAGGDSAGCGSMELVAEDGGGGPSDDFVVTDVSNVSFNELMKMHADITINNTEPHEDYELVIYADGEFEGRHGMYSNEGGNELSNRFAIPEELGQWYDRFSPGDTIEVGFSAHKGGLEGNGPGPQATDTITWDPPEAQFQVEIDSVPDVIEFADHHQSNLQGIAPAQVGLSITNISGRYVNYDFPFGLDFGGIDRPGEDLSPYLGNESMEGSRVGRVISREGRGVGPFATWGHSAGWQQVSGADDVTFILPLDVEQIEVEGNNTATIPIDDSGALKIIPDGETRECTHVTGCEGPNICVDHSCQPCSDHDQCDPGYMCHDGECKAFLSPCDPAEGCPDGQVCIEGEADEFGGTNHFCVPEAGADDLTVVACDRSSTVVEEGEALQLETTVRNTTDTELSANVTWTLDGTLLDDDSIDVPPNSEATATIQHAWLILERTAGTGNLTIGTQISSPGVSALSTCGSVEIVPPTVQPGCEGDSDCPPNQVCAGGNCVPAGSGGDCSEGDCPEGEECLDGNCVPAGSGGECGSDSECPEGEVCIDGFCYPLGSGPGDGGGGDNDWLWIAGGIAAAGAGAVAYLRQRNNGSSRNGSSRSRR